MRAVDPNGAPGVEEIPFVVRNGPGIAVFGIHDGETVRGNVSLLVNAYASRVGDEFEPRRAESPAPVPTWAWVLSLAVATWALYYAAAEYRDHAASLAVVAPLPGTRAAPDGEPANASSPAPETAALGEQVFGNYCAACHQLSGEGVPGVFPPLRGDPVVLADDPTEHVSVILNGLSGKTIGGVAYASPMPALGGQLSDEQVAAVVNHERRAWGNRAPAIEAADVAAVRSTSSGSTTSTSR